MSDNHSVSEGGRDYGAFIPRMIDDYGLDPYEFRIYCRLERRIGKGEAGCFESIASMAEACKMSRQKVRDALQVLVLSGIARQEKCPGKTDRYILMSFSNWAESNQLGEIRQQVTAYRKESDAKVTAKNNEFIPSELRRSQPPNYDVVDTELRRSQPPNYDVVDTELRRSHKGSPIKDLQLRISNEGEEAAAALNVQMVAEENQEGTAPSTVESQVFKNVLALKPEVKAQDKFSPAPETLENFEAMKFDWRLRPWMLNAVDFKPEVVQAVWQSNTEWYSIPGKNAPNLKRIYSQLKSLDDKVRALNADTASAYVELRNYWTTAQALSNPEIEQAFAYAVSNAKQKSIANKLEANKRITYDAIKDL